MSEPTGVNGFQQRYATILQSLVVLGILLAGIWAGVIAPMQERLKTNETNIKDLEMNEGNKFLTTPVHEEFKKREDDKIDALRRDLEKTASDVAFLRDNQVPRSEHIFHWNTTEKDNATLHQEFDTLRKDFGGQWTVSRAIESLEKRVDELQQERKASFFNYPLQQEKGK
jgi:uncharacterized membrane protein YgaE (UPF0421/DUF939 family)